MMNNDLVANVIRHTKTNNFKTRVAMGLVDGWQSLNKFGAGTCDTSFKVINPNMANEQYPFLIDENKVMTIQSDNALDTGQVINVKYVEYVSSDDSWRYKEGKATTNGVTPVTVQEIDDDGSVVGDANIMIPFRMINRGVGVSNTGGAVGTITLENGGTEYASIVDGDNQSLLAFFPIATDYSCVILGVGRSVIGSSKACDFHYKAIPYGQPSQTKRTVGLVESASYENFEMPFVFPEKTILTVEAKIDVGSAEVSAWFDGLVVENEKLT